VFPRTVLLPLNAIRTPMSPLKEMTLGSLTPVPPMTLLDPLSMRSP